MIATALAPFKAVAYSSAGNGRNRRSLITPTFLPFALKSSTAFFAVPAADPINNMM